MILSVDMIFDVGVSVFYFALVCCCCILLVLFRIRWRSFLLPAKYALWQKEAQKIEEATHEVITCPNCQGKNPYPSISLVMPVCNQEERLEYIIKKYLSLIYDGMYELIIVDQWSTDRTPDIVKNLQTLYANLRYTSLPRTLRYITHRKIAITLGIKASRMDWVLIVNPDTLPSSKDWLQFFAENLTSDLNFVQGYYNYEDNETLAMHRHILERMLSFASRLDAFERGIMLGCETSNIAFRKEWFLKNRGFADSLELPFGEEFIFVAKHAKPINSSILCSADTRLFQENTSVNTLLEEDINKSEIISQLSGSVGAYKLREILIGSLYYLFLFCFVSYSIIRLNLIFCTKIYDPKYVYADFFFVLMIVLFVGIPIHCINKSSVILGERKYGLYLLLHELLIPWRIIYVDILRRSKRKSFCRNFI